MMNEKKIGFKICKSGKLGLTVCTALAALGAFGVHDTYAKESQTNVMMQKKYSKLRDSFKTGN